MLFKGIRCAAGEWTIWELWLEAVKGAGARRPGSSPAPDCGRLDDLGRAAEAWTSPQLPRLYARRILSTAPRVWGPGRRHFHRPFPIYMVDLTHTIAGMCRLRTIQLNECSAISFFVASGSALAS